MKKLYIALQLFCIGLLVSISVFAQQNKDYSILLNSGKFTPVENSKSISYLNETFKKSLFGNSHYLVLQFNSLPSDNEKKTMLDNGIKLLDYLPNYAYTASLKKDISPNSLTNIRSVFQLSDAQKTLAPFLKGKFPAHAVKTKGTVDLTITTYDKISLKEIEASIKKLNIIVLADIQIFKNFTLRVPQNNFKKLVGLSFVQWVEAIDPPNISENLLGRSLHRVNELNDGVRNLKGNGINIGIWDGGKVDAHIDFSPIATRLNIVENVAVSEHGTHCSGTIGGGGLLNPKARGMAPKAKIFSWDFGGNIPVEQAAGIPANNLAVSSHSYGGSATCGLAGASVAYSSGSRNTDLNLNNFPNHLHVHSAGNSQTSCSGGWSTITGSGKSSKNNILVANITATETLSGSSSCGPVLDGRVKPEISAFGTNVLSTILSNGYANFTGTSMAAPGVAGSVSLLVERYRQLNANANPISTLIKNSVLNTAQDLGNVGPDYRFGFGRLNALAAIRILEQNRYAINTISTGVTNDLTLTIPAGASKLRVMLTWNDPAGTANASVALVNNLDLVVQGGATTTLPWVLDPTNPSFAATKSTDNVSNIEQVEINNPVAGIYTLKVSGAAIPSGPQQYAITWNIDQPGIEVIYPNGNEFFTPGISETITWDNSGLSGTQTIEYSLNNGTTWTTIATGLAATITRFAWTPPAGSNTSTALVRVTSGSFTDVSDATFHILSTPSNLVGNAANTCTAGSVNLNWSAVAEATVYDVLWLNQTTGTWIVMGNNIAGTTYTITGLTAGTLERFSIIAKNTTTNAISERAIAISATTSTSGIIVLATAATSTTFCTGGSVTLTATSGQSYAWSNGATSQSITTSTAGNYNVVVTQTGGCVSTSNTIPVVVNPQPAINITNTGNTTFCQGNSVTLTATAGNSYLWSNGATTQTISPNTAGSYSVTVNQGNSCSNTSAPKVVTVNPLPIATVTANGPTTICEGNTASLTASGGSSYLWSNGSTMQSITVNTASNNSVVVTNNFGCSAISAAVNVSIAPKPIISISADPFTNLYPGLSTRIVANTTASTVTWYKNGIPNGLNSLSIPISFNDKGSYFALLTNAAGCTNTSNIISIGDSVSTKLFVYPNPNNGQFQLSFFNAAASKNNFNIFDAKGSRVYSKIFATTIGYQTINMNLNFLSTGTYNIVMYDVNGKTIGENRFMVL